MGKKLSPLVLPVSEVIPQFLYPNSPYKSQFKSNTGQSGEDLSGRLETQRGEWSRAEQGGGGPADRLAIPDTGQTRDVGTAVVI